MESWRAVWRRALAPMLSTNALEALRQAIRDDSPKLCQMATTVQPPLQSVADWPVEAACVIGFCGWADLRAAAPAQDRESPEETVTVSEVEEFFARACYDIDQRLGEPAGCRWFINWADLTPRAEMLAALLPEVELALAARGAAAVAAAG